jgi:hypothetical protein
MKATPEKLAALSKRLRRDRLDEIERLLAAGHTRRVVLEVGEAMVAIDDLLLVFARQGTDPRCSTYERVTDLRTQVAAHVFAAGSTASRALLTDGQAIRRVRRAAAELRAMHSRLVKRPAPAVREAA